MAQAPRKGFLIAGGLALALAFLFRKNVKQSVTAVGTFVVQGLDVATESLLRRVEKLAVKPTIAYDMLPPGPPEIGPLAPNTNIDDLTPEFRAKIAPLESLLTQLLTPHKITFRRGETLRTWARQTFLFGIARAYRAPGRTGTVTNAITATGNHPKGRAIDYNFSRYGKYLGDAAGSEEVRKILLPHVAKFAAIGVAWGGVWTRPDVPHFEQA